jgi:hypothetical protein
MANTTIPIELSSTPGIVDNSNATAITIDSSENVGIGQTSPQAGLDLGSSAKGTWSSGNAYHYPSGNAYIKVQGTAAEDDWIGIAGNYNQSSGSANLLLQANLRLVNEQAGNYIGSEAQSVTSSDITFGKLIGGSSTGVNATKSEFMRIDSTGQVGIGTTDPKSTLEVKGTFGPPATSGFAQGFISRFSQTTGIGSLDVGFGDPYSWLQSRASNDYSVNYALALNPNGGNVGIGTDSPNELLTLYKSTAAQTATQYGNSNTGDGSGNGFVVGVESLGNGLVWQRENTYIRFGTNATERMRIDSSGNLLVGTSSAYGTTGITLQQDGLVYARRTGVPSYFRRDGSDGDIIYMEKDGTAVGSIGAKDGDIVLGTGDTGLRFLDGSDAITPHNISTNAGRDNAIDLGSLGARFDDIYATNGTIQTSDRNEKQDIEDLTEAETRVAVAAKGLLRKFRWKDAVAEKGDEARTHFGIIAQDLQDAFTAEGLDAGDYAMFISSTWTDDDGVEQTRLGVRYSELLAFIIAAI